MWLVIFMLVIVFPLIIWAFITIGTKNRLTKKTIIYS